MNATEPGYYKSLTIHLLPDQTTDSEKMFLNLTFHLEEQYPEQVKNNY